MQTYTKYELGKMAFIILIYKIKRQGMDIRPKEFLEESESLCNYIKCSRDEFKAFVLKFLVPEALRGCGLDAEIDKGIPTEREAEIAYLLLKRRFFWNIQDARGEAYRISEKTPLDFQQVAAVVIHLLKSHIAEQFGEGETLELKIAD